MDALFPFGLPGPTAFYQVLYLVTLVVHVLFMNYVLAGSLYLAWTALRPGQDGPPRERQPLAGILRDWLPFSLSAAITAGVAPLLFIQILYRRNFYTANLLLGWRWLVVIPALVIAFYLLYLLKSRALSDWSFAARGAVGIGAAACLLFTAFCWTANHLLSADAPSWPAVYQTRSVSHVFPALVPRLLTWCAGSFATMAAMVAWQLYYAQQRGVAGNLQQVGPEVRRLAGMAIGGLVVAPLAGAGYLAAGGPAIRSTVFGAPALPYVIVAGLGGLSQVVGWSVQLRSAALKPPLLTAISVACAVTLLSTTAVREVIRLATIDVAELSARHAAAARVGGFGLFLASAALNAALIAFCLLLVARELSQRQQQD